MSNASSLPWLRLTNPWVQNFVSGMCLFLAVGIYLAITGLGAGAGKPSSIQVATTTNAILYALFTTCGFFGGSVMNTIGPKLTFMIGIFGYPFYASGLWYFDATGHKWYPLLSGAVLGICAALLWTVAGFIQFAYGTEKQKGQYIAIQTFLLAAGSTVGSSIPLGININNRGTGGVPTSVYATFVALMASAIFLAAFCIIDPKRVIRSDGTHLAVFQPTNFRSEFKWCLRLIKDWRLLALLLPMFSTEIMLAVIPTLNSYACNLRTRSLNNFLFNMIQMPASALFSFVLDNRRFDRRTRGLIALGISFAFTLTGWILTFHVQLHFDLQADAVSPAWDFTSGGGSAEFTTVMLIFGIIYAINQMVVMWTLAALTNDPFVLARYAGLYKAMLSAGLCITFGLIAAGVDFLAQTILQTVLMMVSFPIMAFVIIKCVKDTNYFKEDIVIPPKQAEEDMGLTFGDSHVEGNVGFGPNEDFVDSKTKEKVESHGHAAST